MKVCTYLPIVPRIDIEIIVIESRGSCYIGAFEDLAALPQQIAYRFLMRHMGARALDIVCRQSREAARAGFIEAEEPDRLADGVVFQIGRRLLAQFDRHAIAHT